VVNQAVTLENPSTQTVPSSAGPHLCIHTPNCPTAEAADHEAAVPVATHPEQGWSLLCNGVVLFEDTGELLPDGRIIGPRRLTDPVHAGPLGTKGAGTTATTLPS
jgi:Family of unknown function (DUF5999)